MPYILKFKPFKSKNDGQEKKKLEAYYKKQNEMIHRKEIKEKEQLSENREKNLIMAIRNKHLTETKERFEMKNEKFKTELENKLNIIDNRIKSKKQQNENEIHEKFEFLAMRREDKYENLQRMEKIGEYEREKQRRSINERMSRIEELK